MKKNQLKALVKSARKTTKENIRLSVLTQLKDTTAKLGLTSKKINKEIEKSAKQLAKKLSAEVKIDKDALALNVAVMEQKAAEPQKPVKKAAVKAPASEPKPVPAS